MPEAEAPALDQIPLPEPKPRNRGTLALNDADGVPVLTVTGGQAIPYEIAVANRAGKVVATYTAGPAPARTAPDEQLDAGYQADTFTGQSLYLPFEI